MSRTAVVITTIRQEIEIPEDGDKQDVLNFLAAYQDFGQFVTLDDEEGHRITAIEVIDDDVMEIDE
jgi:hypothetical protein